MIKTMRIVLIIGMILGFQITASFALSPEIKISEDLYFSRFRGLTTKIPISTPNDLEKLCPKFSEFLSQLRPASQKRFLAWEWVALNEAMGGDRSLWTDVVETAETLPDFREQRDYYCYLSNLIAILKAKEGDWRTLFRKTLTILRERPIEGKFNFFVSIDKIATKTAWNPDTFLEILQGRRPIFGGYNTLPKNEIKGEIIDKEKKEHWEEIARRIDREEEAPGYLPGQFKRKMVVFLRELDNAGMVGQLVLDLGSAAFPVIRGFYHDKGKHAFVGIDISLREPSDDVPVYAPVRLVKGDVQNLDEVLHQESVAEFLANLYGSNLVSFDAIVCSDILNYVDYQRVIQDALRYLKPGGRLVIFNMAGVVAAQDLESQLGVQKNSDLIKFISKLGVEVEFHGYLNGNTNVMQIFAVQGKQWDNVWAKIDVMPKTTSLNELQENSNDCDILERQIIIVRKKESGEEKMTNTLDSLTTAKKVEPQRAEMLSVASRMSEPVEDLRTDSSQGKTKRLPRPELEPVIVNGELYWGLTDKEEMSLNSIALRAPKYDCLDTISKYLLRKYPLSTSTRIGFSRAMQELRGGEIEEDLILLIGFNKIQRKMLQVVARNAGVENKIRFIKTADIKTVDFLIREGGEIIDVEGAGIPFQIINRPANEKNNTIESAI